jgi:GH24 family phage-related lysozyme (muramidase)
VDDTFLTTISSKPPKAAVEGAEAAAAADCLTHPDAEVPCEHPIDRGAELYTEDPPTLQGLMRFMGKDVFELVKNYEHTEAKMYWDGGAKGKGYPTIGVGHLIKPGEKLNGKNLMTATLTPQEIEQLFVKDLTEHAEPLIEHLRPEVLKGMASLAFNIGPGGIDRRGRKLGFKYSPVVTALNSTTGTPEERLQKAADGFARHIFSKGQRLNGLVSRRLGERTLFLRPDAKPADLPGYDRPKLKGYIDNLNKVEGANTVKYDDMWPPSRPRAKKK